MEPIDYQAVLSRNLRRLRDERGMTQVELATMAGRMGMGWTIETVIAIEGGRRRLNFGEGLLVAGLLDSTLSKLAEPGEDEDVVVEGVTLPANAWRALLSDKRTPAFLLNVAIDMHGRAVRAEARDDAERQAARRLGMKPAELVELAHELWNDRGLTAERDRRLLEQVGKGPISKPARQALRGHITRRLLQELAEYRIQRQEKMREGLRQLNDVVERLGGWDNDGIEEDIRS
jgi:transcriptional regulator with XRE-family HTH domain